MTAQAAEIRSIRVKPDLYFDGTTAICSVSVKADSSNDKVKATLTLYQGNDYVSISAKCTRSRKSHIILPKFFISSFCTKKRSLPYAKVPLNRSCHLK